MIFSLKLVYKLNKELTDFKVELILGYKFFKFRKQFLSRLLWSWIFLYAYR